MRIAMLTNNYLPFVGGVPISIQRLADGLRSLGNEVYVFAPSYNEMNLDNHDEKFVIRYRSFEKKTESGFVIPNFLDPIIRKAFDRLNFDVIHVHHPILIGNTALYLKKKYGIPVVFTYHTRYEQYLHYIDFYHKLQRRYVKEPIPLLKRVEGKMLQVTENKIVPYHIKRFANQCDYVFAPTMLMKDHLINQGCTTNIDVLPTGLNNTSYCRNREASTEIRKQYGKESKYLLCTVSRLEKEKNISFLLRGIYELKSTLGEDFHLLIIGDGTRRADLEGEVDDLGLNDNVTFVGTVPQERITNFYLACDLFVFSSKSETQGIVLLEAMAAGLPVVAVKATGVNDIVFNLKNGFTTNEMEEEYASAIRYLLLNKESYESASNGAFQTANEYKVVTVSKKAEALYREAIKEKGDLYAVNVGRKKRRQKNVISYHSLIS